MRTPKKITDSAKDEQCTLNISEGVCNYDIKTTSWDHFPDGTGGSNRLTGVLNGGYGCSSCHDVIDGRVPSNLTFGDREFYMRRSTKRTNDRLIEKGLVKVEGLK